MSGWLNLDGMVHVDYEDGWMVYVNRVGHSLVLLIIYESLYWTSIGAHLIKLVMLSAIFSLWLYYLTQNYFQMICMNYLKSLGKK